MAAVSISAVYNSNIIGYAVNGATDYAGESVKENEILDQTASIMESAIGKIESINGGNTGSTEEPENPDVGGGDEEEETPPVEEPEVGIDFGEMSEEEITNNYVGKYVDYTPTSGSFTSEGQYNGSGNQTFSTVAGLKWRILDTTDNTLTLISDKSIHNGFSLGGYNGYNNGVLLLNNACRELYSNKDWAVGRSLNIDDIEAYSYYSKEDLIQNYNTQYTLPYSYYPNIFAKELNGAPNGTYGIELDLSEQDEYITGNLTGNNYFMGKPTYYTLTMSTSTMKSQIYVDLFSTSTQNWVASRCVLINSLGANFDLFHISNATIDAGYLYYSDGNGNGYSYAIRPIVEIDLTKVNVGITGTGADGDGYSLTLK